MQKFHLKIPYREIVEKKRIDFTHGLL